MNSSNLKSGSRRKKMRFYAGILAIMLFCVTPVTSEAALIFRGTDSLGFQLIYDTDLNITWYDYQRDRATWGIQSNWADTLTVNFAGTAYSNWRLPTILNPYNPNAPCFGANCTDSEMGYLFYNELGAPTGEGPNNLLIAPFTDGATGQAEEFMTIIHDFYWTDTLRDLNPATGQAWNFYFSGGGYQEYANTGTAEYAMAVMDGDVAPVPLPASILLLTSGLAGIFSTRIKRNKKV